MENFFRLQKLIMWPTGLWPLPNESRREFFKICIVVLNLLLTEIVGIAELLQALESKDVVTFIEGLTLCFTGQVNGAKVIGFLAKRAYFRETILGLKDLHDKCPLPETDEVTAKSFKQWKFRADMVTKIVGVIYCSPVVLYHIVPLIIYLKSGALLLVFPTKFFVDITKFKFFIPVFVMQSIHVWLLIFTFITSETFFASSVMYLCSRIDVLKRSIEEATSEAIAAEKTTPLLGKTIEYHKLILRVCDMIGTFYSPILLAQFFISTVTLCMLLFLTTQTNIPVEKKMAFFCYFLTISVQLFMYCYFGQLLQSKFEMLQNHVFGCSWYETPVAYQKDIYFLIMRCGLPVTLTAYKIMPVNLESYFSICKTSMSYLALLQGMEDK